MLDMLARCAPPDTLLSGPPGVVLALFGMLAAGPPPAMLPEVVVGMVGTPPAVAGL